MSEGGTQLIDVDQLQIGHFVHIDLGWMEHPFPLNSFRIQSEAQIQTIRALGIYRVRYSPARSAPRATPDASAPPEPAARGATAVENVRPAAQDCHHPAPPNERLLEQSARLAACEREFGHATRSFGQILEHSRTRPTAARDSATALVARIRAQLAETNETCIRLLSEKVGERACHEVNVTVISLLLARNCGLDHTQVETTGLGALLHDIGKLDLPDRLRYESDPKSAAERMWCEDHVSFGVERGAQMGLARDVLDVIAQHHERADGSGYPGHLRNERMSPAARIVTLVNHYDNLCNPANPALALTPHEALSHLFARTREHFDAPTVSALIRMMGVYPAGSVVQLSDDRFALVVSVHPQRPLRPKILIHDPNTPRDDALEHDLADTPELGIRRSLRPAQLPRAALDYLSPRQRICYFFERGRGAGAEAANS